MNDSEIKGLTKHHQLIVDPGFAALIPKTRPDELAGLEKARALLAQARSLPEVLRVRGLRAAKINDSEYLEIEQRIDSSESDAIQNRWRFGQMMLAERKGQGRLPNRRMEALIKLTGKSKSELSYRAQFVQKYPTEEQLSNAVGQFKSWHAIVESL